MIDGVPVGMEVEIEGARVSAEARERLERALAPDRRLPHTVP